MSKLTPLNTRVTFTGHDKKNDIALMIFVGTVVGYGHVMGTIWSDEPEQVVLVDLAGERNGVVAVGVSGLSFA